jgi:hypothetical protein
MNVLWKKHNKSLSLSALLPLFNFLHPNQAPRLAIIRSNLIWSRHKTKRVTSKTSL